MLCPQNVFEVTHNCVEMSRSFYHCNVDTGTELSPCNLISVLILCAGWFFWLYLARVWLLENLCLYSGTSTVFSPFCGAQSSITNREGSLPHPQALGQVF